MSRIRHTEESERSTVVEAAAAARSSWPIPENFGTENYHLQVEAVLKASGDGLLTAAHAAHTSLREALGEGGFELLDRYVSANAEAACAREAAVAAVCYGQGLGSGRAGEHAQLGEAVVGALLESAVPAGTALRVATDALFALRAATESAA